MFERLGSLTYRFRFVIVVAWVAAAIWSVLFAPSLAAEGMTDQTAFLPADTGSMRAHAALERSFPGRTAETSATVAFARDGGLTRDDKAYIAAVAAWVVSDDAPALLSDAVTGVDTAASRPELEAMLRSDDGVVEIVNVNLTAVVAAGAGDDINAALREHLRTTAPAGLRTHVTGAVGIGSDYLAAITEGTDRTTLVTVVLVIAILLVIYRAPLAAMVPLATIGAAFVVARGVLGVLALLGWQVSSLLDTFLVVLVFGVGTDYAIFLISRFREEVPKSDWHTASIATSGRIGAVISASAATVIVGLGAMAFGDFGMIQTTGPALAVGIFVTLVAGLTLTPALLGIFGHHLFWPLRPRAHADDEGFFGRLAAAVSRRPGVVTVALLAVLVVPLAGIPRMATNFDVLAELPAESDARAGYDLVAEHLGRGKIVQATGIVAGDGDLDVLEPASLARLRDVMVALRADPGVATATSLVTPEGDGVVPEAFVPSAQLREMARSFEDDGAATGAASEPDAVLDDEVLDGLDAAVAYVEALDAAFPEVGAATAARTVGDSLAEARAGVVRAREGAVVSTQLRTLADALTSPAMAAAGSKGSSGSIDTVRDYLTELAGAFPEVAADPDLADAQAAVASLAKAPTIRAALDLADALEALATTFDDRPDALLVPESLSGTPEARAARRALEGTFDRLPGELDALADLYAARPDDVFVPVGLGIEGSEDLDDAVAAFVAHDRTATRFYLTTADDPYSPAAFAAIRRVEAALAEAAPSFGAGTAAHIGGPTAQFADVETVLGGDFTKVGVITVLGILLVLMLLLRAVVAPIYLVATVLLSCGTALGLSSWFFQDVLGHPGVSFYLPILVFVLLVALGSDYNIFLMSRVREESEGRPIRDGIRIASGRTGAVITSAGLILAGTFGSMATAPLIVLFQVGVTVAVGVLIDTFLVRSILVPAITTIAGDRAWWPSGMRLGARWWRVLVPVPGPAVADARPSRLRLGLIVAMTALVPVVFAGLFVWSFADPTANLRSVAAAVVDEDEGATVVDVDGTARRIDLGADLAASLVADTASGTFAWTATDAPDARDGLGSGRFGAVLTIPRDFSRTVSAVTRDGAADAARASLRLETSEAASGSIATIARAISGAIADSTADTITAEYVDRVLVRVNAAQGQVAAAAGRAESVATGSTDLVGGSVEVSTVAGELVAGLSELAAGANAASDGVDRLATGVGELAAATEDLPAQAGELAAGASGVADGAAGLAGGTGDLAGSLGALAAAATGLADGAATLDAGADGIAAGATDLAAGAAESAGAAAALASGAGELAASVEGYTGSVAALAADCATLGGTPALCGQLELLAAGGGPLAAGSATLADGAGQLAGGTAAVAAGASDLAAGAAAVDGGAGELASGAAALATGAAQAAAGADAIASGASELAAGASAVADGTAAFATSVPALVGAIDELDAGARGLAVGADKLAGGIGELASGASTLESGARAAADGASALAGGTASAADGASALVEGMRQAADGAAMVAAGADGLVDDSETVAGEAGELANRLADGAASIRTYSEAERAALGGVVADPVTVETAGAGSIVPGGSGLAPYFMALALWVGALAVYLGLPGLVGRSDRRAWWQRALGGFVAGAAVAGVGAVLMVLVVRFGLGLEVARLPELLAVAVLAALAFVAVVQALVAALGSRGWFVGLLLTALQLTSAGASYPVATAPAFFQAVHPLLPMTYAVEAFRTLVAGGTAPVGPGVAVLAGWLVGGLLVTLAAAHHERTVAAREAMMLAA